MNKTIRNIVAAALIILLAVLAYLMIRGAGMPDTALETAPVITPQLVAIEGTFQCLPHKNTSGPQTLECAFGIQTQQGSHLALDTTVLEPAFPQDLRAGDFIRATGSLIQPQEGSQWNRYDIEGVLRVTSLEKL